jgi:hypothetical protein
MKRPSVDPAFTFGISLVVSLVLWYPTLRATMAGDLDITDAGIRYFLALAIAWAGVYGVAALVAMYASQPREPTPPPGASQDEPQRRHDDPANAEPQPASEEQEPSAA